MEFEEVHGDVLFVGQNNFSLGRVVRHSLRSCHKKTRVRLKRGSIIVDKMRRGLATIAPGNAVVDFAALS